MLFLFIPTMTPEKDYINKDIFNQTEEEFQQRVKLPEIEDDFLAKLEWSLLFLSGKYSDMRHSDARNSIRSIKAFDGAWLLNVNRLYDQSKTENIKVLAPFRDLQVAPEMFPDLNITFMDIKDTAQLQKFRVLSFKERRGLMSKYKYILSHKFAYYDASKEKWYGIEEGYGYNGVLDLTTDFARKYVAECKDMDDTEIKKRLKESETPVYNIILPIPCVLKPRYGFHPEYIKKWETYFYDVAFGKSTDDIEDDVRQALGSVNIAYQVALTGYYEWFVYIRETPDSVGFKIPIMPEASKEVFVMRDIPEGKTRKKAIVNFVREHYRTKPNTNFNEEERRSLVRKHFRGENKFNWRGLEVHIIPSQYDLNKIASSKKFLNI